MEGGDAVSRPQGRQQLGWRLGPCSSFCCPPSSAVSSLRGFATVSRCGSGLTRRSAPCPPSPPSPLIPLVPVFHLHSPPPRPPADSFISTSSPAFAPPHDPLLVSSLLCLPGPWSLSRNKVNRSALPPSRPLIPQLVILPGLCRCSVPTGLFPTLLIRIRRMRRIPRPPARRAEGSRESPARPSYR